MIKTFLDDAACWLFAYALWPLYWISGLLTLALPISALAIIIYNAYSLLTAGISFGSLPLAILFPLVWAVPLTAVFILGNMYINNLLRWSDAMRSGLRRQAEALAGRTT